MAKQETYELYRHLRGELSDSSAYLFKSNYPDLLFAERVARTVLPYSQRFNPNLTLHDASHSERVINHINSIIDIISKYGGKLSILEIKILYYSAWYHDVGIVLSYEEYGETKPEFNHAEISSMILKRYSDEFFWGEDPEYKEKFADAVCSVILSHKNGFENVPDVCKICNEPVRLNLLCSILCLADLCEVNIKRAPRIVYTLLSDKLNIKPLDREGISHWIANMNTEVSILPDRDTILITYVAEKDCKVILDLIRKWGPHHVNNICRQISFPIKFEYYCQTSN